MFSGSTCLGAVSFRGMCRTPFESPWLAGPQWRGHAGRFAAAVAVFLAAFIPLAAWFR
jgi:hypothetical protein